jgi:hypothetical protein
MRLIMYLKEFLKINPWNPHRRKLANQSLGIIKRGADIKMRIELLGMHTGIGSPATGCFNRLVQNL